MPEPTDLPLPTIWSTETPDRATMLVVAEQDLYARCGEHLVAVDPRSGKLRWSANLGAAAGEGSLLLAAGATVVTDARTGPKRTTELIGVRGGKVAYRTAMDCIVGNQGGAVLGSEVFVLGVDPKGGAVLRSMRCDDGHRH